MQGKPCQCYRVQVGAGLAAFTVGDAGGSQAIDTPTPGGKWGLEKLNIEE